MRRASRMPVRGVSTLAKIDLAKLRKFNTTVLAAVISMIGLLTVELINLLAFLTVKGKRTDFCNDSTLNIRDFRRENITVFLCESRAKS